MFRNVSLLFVFLSLLTISAFAQPGKPSCGHSTPSVLAARGSVAWAHPSSAFGTFSPRRARGEGYPIGESREFVTLKSLGLAIAPRK
jgi:hypothetical protein